MLKTLPCGGVLWFVCTEACFSIKARPPDWDYSLLYQTLSRPDLHDPYTSGSECNFHTEWMTEDTASNPLEIHQSSGCSSVPHTTPMFLPKTKQLVSPLLQTRRQVAADYLVPTTVWTKTFVSEYLERLQASICDCVRTVQAVHL